MRLLAGELLLLRFGFAIKGTIEIETLGNQIRKQRTAPGKKRHQEKKESVIN